MNDRKNILIVDDDKDVSSVIEMYLESQGYKTDIAKNGKECLAKIKSNPPALVLLDIIMPTMSGYDVINKIKQMEKPYSEIPVVLLTSKTQKKDIKEGLKLGACGYITKPFKNDDIKQIIDETLNNKSKKILIIYDDEQIAENLSLFLSSSRYKCYISIDGKTGLKNAKEIKPDLIIVDVVMPGMDGYQVCKKLRKNGFKDIPIFIMSAKDIDLEEKSSEIEATASIRLPYKNEELLELVKKHLL